MYAGNRCVWNGEDEKQKGKTLIHKCEKVLRATAGILPIYLYIPVYIYLYIYI